MGILILSSSFFSVLRLHKLINFITTEKNIFTLKLERPEWVREAGFKMKIYWIIAPRSIWIFNFSEEGLFVCHVNVFHLSDENVSPAIFKCSSNFYSKCMISICTDKTLEPPPVFTSFVTRISMDINTNHQLFTSSQHSLSPPKP